MSAEAAPPGAAAAKPEPPSAEQAAEGAARPLLNLLADTSALFGDLAELLATEGEMAGRALVAMLALAALIGLLLASTWLLLNAALAAWLLIVFPDLPAPLLLLGLAATQLLATALAWLLMRRVSRDLGFRGFSGAVSALLGSRKAKSGAEAST